jgi:hypothetical protein
MELLYYSSFTVIIYVGHFVILWNKSYIFRCLSFERYLRSSDTQPKMKDLISLYSNLHWCAQHFGHKFIKFSSDEYSKHYLLLMTFCELWLAIKSVLSWHSLLQWLASSVYLSILVGVQHHQVTVISLYFVNVLTRHWPNNDRLICKCIASSLVQNSEVIVSIEVTFFYFLKALLFTILKALRFQAVQNRSHLCRGA